MFFKRYSHRNVCNTASNIPQNTNNENNKKWTKCNDMQHETQNKSSQTQTYYIISFIQISNTEKNWSMTLETSVGYWVILLFQQYISLNVFYTLRVTKNAYGWILGLAV